MPINQYYAFLSLMGKKYLLKGQKISKAIDFFLNSSKQWTPKSISWASSPILRIVIFCSFFERIEDTIVWCIKNRSYLWVGHFMTLTGHFFANYINIFHKIELPTIILMCLTCLNLIWIKSYDIKHIFFHFLFFAQ